jgi:hypothetical protein
MKSACDSIKVSHKKDGNTGSWKQTNFRNEQGPHYCCRRTPQVTDSIVQTRHTAHEDASEFPLDEQGVTHQADYL